MIFLIYKLYLLIYTYNYILIYNLYKIFSLHYIVLKMGMKCINLLLSVQKLLIKSLRLSLGASIFQMWKPVLVPGTEFWECAP